VPDTSLQKMFLLLGPTRSGKGTIGRLLTELVGAANVCAPTMNSLGTAFGLQPLLGKQLAVVSDMRLGRKSDHALIAENLLRISGEDPITADRKYKESWTGKLGTRFLIMANAMPGFVDASGALANRFIPLVMEKSFLGKENPNLMAELRPELPGILNWAMAGWRRLHERGNFELPETSKAALSDLADLASPVTSFVRERCELGPQHTITKEVLYSAWRAYCEDRGYFVGSASTFGRDLMAAYPGQIRTSKPREGGERKPSYQGIKTRSAKLHGE